MTLVLLLGALVYGATACVCVRLSWSELASRPATAAWQYAAALVAGLAWPLSLGIVMVWAWMSARNGRGPALVPAADFRGKQAAFSGPGPSKRLH